MVVECVALLLVASSSRSEMGQLWRLCLSGMLGSRACLHSCTSKKGQHRTIVLHHLHGLHCDPDRLLLRQRPATLFGPLIEAHTGLPNELSKQREKNSASVLMISSEKYYTVTDKPDKFE